MTRHSAGFAVKLSLCMLGLFAQSGCTMFDFLDSKDVKLLKNSTYESGNAVTLKDGSHHDGDPFGGPGSKIDFAWSVSNTDLDGKTPIAVVLLTFSQSSSMPPEQKLFAMALDGDKYKQTSFLDKTRLGAVDIKKCAAAGNGKFVCDVDSYSYTAQNGQTVARKKAEFTVSSGQLSEPKITE